MKETDWSFIHFNIRAASEKAYIELSCYTIVHTNACHWASTTLRIGHNTYVCTLQIINEILLCESAVIAGQNVEKDLNNLLPYTGVRRLCILLFFDSDAAFLTCTASACVCV